MSLSSRFGTLAARVSRHARPVLALTVVVALAAAFAATRIPTDAGVGTLVDSDTPASRATQQVRQTFGEEPVVVLARGDLQRLILTDDVFRLLRLEGCLSGKVPKGAKPLPGACTELAALDPVEFLSGPATFLNEAVVQIDAQLQRLERHLSAAQLRAYLLDVATRYGITSTPSIDNEEFVATVVFDLSRARGTPKSRLAYLFPNGHSAQIVIRLKPGLSEAERHRAISLIEAAVAETTPRRACAEGGKPAPCFALRGGTYVVSGAPAVVDGLSHALKDALLVLLAVALGVMAVTLALVFRSRLRLLPLALALAAAAITFGAFGLLGGSLTMASIAVLPILIGLAVDYAIQFQARYDEAEASGLAGAHAARRAAAAGGPTIATACLATAAGFLVLLISPTPMIRSFGLLLTAGVAIAFALALTAGLATLTLRRQEADGRRSSGGWHRWRGRERRPLPPPAGSSTGGRPRPPERLLSLALRRPTAVLGVGLALAVVGWAVGTQITTVSDVRQLAPQDLAAVRHLNELQDATGVSGELDVSIEAPDLTDPATIEWMAAFKRRALAANGFEGEDPSCLEAEICPGPALSDFIVRGGRAGHPERGRSDPGGALALRPSPGRPDRPADRRGRDPRVDLVRDPGPVAGGPAGADRPRPRRDRSSGAAGGPPAGVSVELAGLPVIAAAAATDLSASRYWLTLAGLLAVALVLLLVYRSVSRALVPLVPIVLASGWASLALWLTGVPLNPMSAALGALTIAIATEFAVILSGRFHEERAPGAGAGEALRLAYRRTGAAVLASGVTATAGFAVLIASEIQMLRDFGVVTVIDLAAALVGVMVVLPAALVWSGGR